MPTRCFSRPVIISQPKPKDVEEWHACYTWPRYAVYWNRLSQKYSVASTFDAAGTRVKEARIHDNEPVAFAAYFRSLPEVSAVVMEVCWNWGTP